MGYFYLIDYTLFVRDCQGFYGEKDAPPRNFGGVVHLNGNLIS